MALCGAGWETVIAVTPAETCLVAPAGTLVAITPVYGGFRGMRVSVRKPFPKSPEKS